MRFVDSFVCFRSLMTFITRRQGARLPFVFGVALHPQRYFLTLSPPEGESSHCHCHCHCHSSTNQCSWSVHLHRQTRYKHFWMLKRPAGFLLLRKVVIHNTEQNFMHNKPQMRILGKLLRSRGQL